MQGELAVAAALDAEFRDDVEGRRAQHLIFLVGERQTGRDDDGVARVDADGIDVFHGADGDDVARTVAQHFKFDLLPAADVFFDEHLRDGRKHEPVVRDEAQLLLVMRDAAARAAQREGGAHDDGIAELVRDRHALLHRIGDVGRDDGLADLLHGLLEELAVLRAVDRVELRADELDAPLVEEAVLGELAAERKPRLPAERGEQGIRPFLDDDALERIFGERLEIDLVRKHVIRHDGGGVGVAEDDVDARILEHAARLCARVVKFRRLPDDDGPGPDHEYFFDITSLRHFLSPSSCSR